jgi:hypothetical protein
MGTDNSPVAIVADIIAKGLKITLTNELQKVLPPAIMIQTLVSLLDSPTIIEQAGMTPKKLPELVEKNPTVAIEVLFKLMSSQQITE